MGDTFIETMTDELNDYKNDSLVRQCGSDIFTSDYVKSQVCATGKIDENRISVLANVAVTSSLATMSKARFAQLERSMRIESPRSPSRFPNVLPRTNPRSQSSRCFTKRLLTT